MQQCRLLACADVHGGFLQAAHQGWVARQNAAMAELLSRLLAAVAKLPADQRAQVATIAPEVQPDTLAHDNAADAQHRTGRMLMASMHVCDLCCGWGRSAGWCLPSVSCVLGSSRHQQPQAAIQQGRLRLPCSACCIAVQAFVIVSGH